MSVHAWGVLRAQLAHMYTGLSVHILHMGCGALCMTSHTCIQVSQYATYTQVVGLSVHGLHTCIKPVCVQLTNSMQVLRMAQGRILVGVKNLERNWFSLFLCFCYSFFVVLRMEPRALYLLDKCFKSQLYLIFSGDYLEKMALTRMTIKFYMVCNFFIFFLH